MGLRHKVYIHLQSIDSPGPFISPDVDAFLDSPGSPAPPGPSTDQIWFTWIDCLALPDPPNATHKHFIQHPTDAMVMINVRKTIELKVILIVRFNQKR